MTAMMIKKSLLSGLVFVCMLHGAPLPACALYADEDLQRMSWVERAHKIATADIAKVVQRADAGDVDSQMILAYALTGDSPLPDNPEKALKYALMAAEKGNPFAQAMLMYIANKYPSLTISKEYAFKMALESSKQGNSIGASNAGTAYLFGVGVEQNLESAFALLAEAHKAGHPEAAARLCLLQSVSEEKQNGSLLLKLVEHQTVFNYECGPKLLSDGEPAPKNASSAIAAPAINKAEAERAAATETARLAALKAEQESAAALKQEESRKAAAARAEQEKKEEAEARRQAGVKAEAERAAATETARLAALKAEEERKAAEKAEQERSARAKAEQVIPAVTKTSVEAGDNHNDRVTKSPAKKYIRYVDRNGLVSWLDEQSKIPPPAPVYHKYEDSNGLVFWVDDVSKIPAEYRDKSMQNGESSTKTGKAAGKSPNQTVRPGAKAVKKKGRRAPARLGAIRPKKRS